MPKRKRKKRTRPALDERHYLAATMIAEGGYTYEGIAAEVGVTRRQLYRWRKRKDFAAVIDRYHVKQADEWRKKMRDRMRPKTPEDIRTLLEAMNLV